MTVNELDSRLNLARTIAVDAGRITLRYFRSPTLSVEHKQDGSPLTVADQESERLMRSRIEAAFPDDGIVGEEFGERAGRNEYRWVLDPIDGTRSFVAGVPLYGTMVGLQRGAEAVIGSIYFPALDEGMYAATGKGSWYFCCGDAPVRARVAVDREPHRRVLLTTCEQSLARRIGFGAWQRLGAKHGVSRTWGDVYGYMLVATGRADVMIDPIMNVWDAAAVMPIIVEAGGRFTDWRGNATVNGGDSVATSGPGHDEILAELVAGIVEP